jgi:hypothetical protein
LNSAGRKDLGDGAPEDLAEACGVDRKGERCTALTSAWIDDRCLVFVLGRIDTDDDLASEQFIATNVT